MQNPDLLTRKWQTIRMRSDRQTDKWRVVSLKNVNVIKKERLFDHFKLQKAKETKQLNTMSGPRLDTYWREKMLMWGILWLHMRNLEYRQQIIYKYIQVTEAEYFTIDMDKNIPIRNIHWQAFRYKRNLCSKFRGKTVCMCPRVWREEGKRHT